MIKQKRFNINHWSTGRREQNRRNEGISRVLLSNPLMKTKKKYSGVNTAVEVCKQECSLSFYSDLMNPPFTEYMVFEGWYWWFWIWSCHSVYLQITLYCLIFFINIIQKEVDKPAIIDPRILTLWYNYTTLSKQSLLRKSFWNYTLHLQFRESEANIGLFTSLHLIVGQPYLLVQY